jgi:hypothetical protein
VFKKNLMSNKKPFNPFYVVLVAAGITFCLTAACYLVLLLRGNQIAPRELSPSAGEHGLLAFIDRYGNQLFIGEVLIIAVATIGAITTDQYWMRRAIAERSVARRDEPSAESSDGEEKSA